MYRVTHSENHIDIEYTEDAKHFVRLCVTKEVMSLYPRALRDTFVLVRDAWRGQKRMMAKGGR